MMAMVLLVGGGTNTFRTCCIKSSSRSSHCRWWDLGLLLFFQASWFGGKWMNMETKVIFQGPIFPLYHDCGRKGRLWWCDFSFMVIKHTHTHISRNRVVFSLLSFWMGFWGFHKKSHSVVLWGGESCSFPIRDPCLTSWRFLLCEINREGK